MAGRTVRLTRRPLTMASSLSEARIEEVVADEEGSALSSGAVAGVAVVTASTEEAAAEAPTAVVAKAASTVVEDADVAVAKARQRGEPRSLLPRCATCMQHGVWCAVLRREEKQKEKSEAFCDCYLATTRLRRALVPT